MSAERDAALLSKMDTLRKSSAEQARELVARVYRDGLVSRAEADTLFGLNERIKRRTPEWDRRFIQAICDYLLETEPPFAWVSDDEADWLLSHLEAAQSAPLDVDIELLLSLLRRAEGAPPRLGVFALRLCCQRIISTRTAEPDDIERVRRALFAPGGSGGLWVSREEARLLFEANDAIDPSGASEAWCDLFARAVGNHLLSAAHPSPETEVEALRRENWLKSDEGGVFSAFGSLIQTGDWFSRVTWSSERAAEARQKTRDAAEAEAARVDSAEESWFLQRLGWDGEVTPAERALIDFLSREAPGFSAGLGALSINHDVHPIDSAPAGT